MNQTPAKYVKAHGLPSLQYVADKSQTPRDTLARWFTDRPERFKAIMIGVKQGMKDE